MKTTLILITLLITTTLAAQDKYDLFMSRMGVEKEVKTFVNNYIDELASENRYGVSASKWEIIKAKIDYSVYFITVKGILQDNYTVNEIDEIFAANDMVQYIKNSGQLNYKPKPEVREKMYKISRVFGKLLNRQIRNLINK